MKLNFHVNLNEMHIMKIKVHNFHLKKKNSYDSFKEMAKTIDKWKLFFFLPEKQAITRVKTLN